MTVDSNIDIQGAKEQGLFATIRYGAGDQPKANVDAFFAK